MLSCAVHVHHTFRGQSPVVDEIVETKITLYDQDRVFCHQVSEFLISIVEQSNLYPPTFVVQNQCHSVATLSHVDHQPGKHHFASCTGRVPSAIGIYCTCDIRDSSGGQMSQFLKIGIDRMSCQIQTQRFPLTREPLLIAPVRKLLCRKRVVVIGLRGCLSCRTNAKEI